MKLQSIRILADENISPLFYPVNPVDPVKVLEGCSDGKAVRFPNDVELWGLRPGHVSYRNVIYLKVGTH